MSNINAQALKVEHINQAYDLLVGFFTANPEIVNGNAPDAHAVSVLQMTLKKVNYAQADNVHTFIRNYVAKRTREGGAAANVNTAHDMARKLFTVVTGKQPEGVTLEEPVAMTTQSAPADVAARTEADGTNESAPKAASGFEPSNLASIEITDEAVQGIDAQLKALTNSRVRSIRDLVGAVGTAEKLVVEMELAVRMGQEKLALHKADQHEKAAEIEFQVPTYKPSGLSDVKIEGPMAAGLDMLVKLATASKVEKVSALLEAIQRAEKAASAKVVELRGLSRDIRAAAPRSKATAVISNGGTGSTAAPIEFEVEMRKASEVFPKAFGQSTSLLEFEVPVLHFAEKHPDVPEVDESYMFYAPVLADALDCLVEGEIPWLYGESGSGKSELFRQIAARLNFPLLRLNMDSHLTRADIVGTNRLVSGPTGAPIMQFIEGILARALQMPCLLLIDEMDLGDPEIMPVFQPVLEGKGLRLLEDGGRYIEPHPWSRIGVTANTIGLGSQDQMYLNAHEQSAATRDRIARYIEMKYLPADKELEVVMTRVPYADKDFAEKVVQLANKARDGRRLKEIHQVFSTRTVERAVRRHAKFSQFANDPAYVVHSTLEVVVLNRCDEQSRSVMKGFIDNIFQV